MTTEGFCLEIVRKMAPKVEPDLLRAANDRSAFSVERSLHEGPAMRMSDARGTFSFCCVT